MRKNILLIAALSACVLLFQNCSPGGGGFKNSNNNPDENGSQNGVIGDISSFKNFVSIPHIYNSFTGVISHKIHDVAQDSTGQIYFATPHGLSITKNNGQSFVNKSTQDGLGSNRVVNIHINSKNDIYLNTYGSISISTDGGQTFKSMLINSPELPDPETVTIRSMAIDPVKDYIYLSLYSVTQNGIYLSKNQGQSFERLPSVQYSSANLKFVNGVLYFTTSFGLGSLKNDGTVLSEINSSNRTNFPPSTISNFYVHTDDSLYIWDYGSNPYGTVYKALNFDSNFDKITTTATTTISGVQVNSNGGMVIVSGRDYIYQNSSSSAFVKSSIESANLNFLKILPSGLTVRTYDSKQVEELEIASQYNASFTKIQPNNLPFSVRNHFMINPLNGDFLVSTDKGLCISKNEGLSFTCHFLGSVGAMTWASVKNSAVAPNGTIYAASNHGLYISTDNGLSFKEAPINFSVAHHVAVDSKGVVYASGGGNFGFVEGIYTSKDNGVSFELFRQKPSGYNDFYVLLLTESGRIYLHECISNKCGYSVGENSESTFKHITSNGTNGLPVDQRIIGVVEDAATNSVYVGTSRGLFVTKNGGDSFQEITNPGGKSIRVSTLSSHGKYMLAGSLYEDTLTRIINLNTLSVETFGLKAFQDIHIYKGTPYIRSYYGIYKGVQD